MKEEDLSESTDLRVKDIPVSNAGNTFTVKKTSGENLSPVKEEDLSESTDLCTICGYDPCVRLELEEMLISIVQSYNDVKANKQIRFCMYTSVVRHIHSCNLRKGVKKKIPDCVQLKIHDLAPDKEYTGYKSLDK